MSSPYLAPVTLALLITVGGMLAGCNKSAPAPSVSAHDAVAVDVALATLSDKASVTVLTGRLEAYRTAQVRARVAGIIEKRTYTEGEDVKAGALLFRIDPAQLIANLQEVEAELAQAKVATEAVSDIAKRSKQLVAIDSISVQQYRKDLFAEKVARAAEQSLAAKVRSAQLQKTYASVTAPISGRARRALVSEGAMVGQDEGTALTTIEQIDPIYVNFSQPTNDFLALQNSNTSGLKASATMPINLKLGNGHRYAHSGTLLFSDTAVDPQTDTVAMRAVFNNPDHLLLPGMYVQVEFHAPDAGPTVLIAQQALTRTRAGAYVMVEDNGHARQVSVHADSLEGKQWRVTSGLSGGERVILDGSALADGQAVAVKPSTSTSAVAESQ
ncbi:efflux RND transporter periplasmic adaptor subunit [Pseudomonas sp. CCI3.2]|uniref:efflux RND transporter periplasmic adaptor subunit n=1 Tax=unclassified Pseudomonas TaxID=196821 RepID=UPI002AC96BE7|nr:MULTISPECIES: efflux RND transporter periplasmic adaptor subunit [unclassified Pseudomonas]MEB0079567.1 efflux RND transporter periplasmic adaptor subunit [Pseudomonas sp. MH10out]MEB0090185.1 efflux RND transporter periplasmic adaptor subunit [Pseudomonas sp. CCI4.2]MEB0102664.1 efflux RND transporter periplasmic adaptor subunit [Pseudomonas sp. CCI3.2]MEB0132536.1 efflux RND transporter periplasmic adaptor subunit [Pseudomonas sp. CCI2.4]MEB0160531.1 efflux RND transporter periplasmic ada